MEKTWYSSYPEGIPQTIDLSTYRSIPDLQDKVTEKLSREIAFSNFDVDMTYQQLYDRSMILATYFQKVLGLKKGDRLAIMMPNLLQYPVIIYAAARIGLIIVNINPLYTARELKFQLEDSEAKAIVIVSNFAYTLQKIYKEVHSLQHILVTNLGDFLGGFKKPLVNFVVKYIKRMVPKWQIDGAINLNQAMSSVDDLKLDPVEVNGEDIAFLQYTGGTTGVPKGAELTHANIIANVLQVEGFIRNVNLSSQDSAVGALPLYHIFSLTVCAFCFYSLGVKTVLITNPRDIPGFVKILKGEKFTVYVGVNTLYNALLHNAEFLKIDLTPVKFAIGGGTAVQSAVSNRWQQRSGRPIIQGYGLTETSPVALINPLNAKQFSGAAGLPIANTDVEIRDDNGKPLLVDQEGELWIKGPQVMKGYWRKPEETAKVIDDRGFFASGDIAKMDENGFVYIVDRKKDMINVSGFNVYPNEVEDIIAMHEGVVEAAVIGVPSERTGEAVKAFVIKEDPNLTKEDIIAFCRENLTAYKVPKIIEFRDELPKTPVGKILRRHLRDEE